MGNWCPYKKKKTEEEDPIDQNGTCVDSISESNVAENDKGKHAQTNDDAVNQENNTEPKRFESTSKSNVAENNKGKHAPTHDGALNQVYNTEPKRNESKRPHTSTPKGDEENDKLQDGGQDAKDQLKTQTPGSYYSDEILQPNSNKLYPVQTQKQDQLARQKEASKEMLYRVYENVIGTLEEFERRCNKRHTKEKLVVSEIDFPDQSDKSDRDVKANMDVQLLLFEEHRKSCPPKFTKEVNGELRMKTIYWAAARGETELDETDEYTTNLYEILVKDKTHHAVLDQPRQPVEHKTMRQTLQFIMKGNAKAMEIECEYQTDPDKMAKDPKTRKTAIRPYVGANRIYMCNTDLQPYLDQDVPGFLESDIK
ncbi:uncharacterized protein LOC127841183 [Dreissena polymorpha]|uniref:Uncharacterized protein n=1 Tax=Dreissena polymorpha TaxID=45954 RepID=A0A9D4IMI7_DREPO|nr:uncharacterized protein LOC127841183 [Dreissena polymorpha]KAH3781206.1 hypothetical protein DPMN_159032 [Dreissena polymorpha]